MTGYRGIGRVGQTLTMWLERVRVGWGMHTHTRSMRGVGRRDGILRLGQRLGQWCRDPSSDDKKAGTCSLGRGRSRA